jgi:hypothetical protein
MIEKNCQSCSRTISNFENSGCCNCILGSEFNPSELALRLEAAETKLQQSDFELMALRNQVWRVKEDCEAILSLPSFGDRDKGMDIMARRIFNIVKGD